jgi:hypothetical protein
VGVGEKGVYRNKVKRVGRRDPPIAINLLSFALCSALPSRATKSMEWLVGCVGARAEISTTWGHQSNGSSSRCCCCLLLMIVTDWLEIRMSHRLLSCESLLMIVSPEKETERERQRDEEREREQGREEGVGGVVPQESSEEVQSFIRNQMLILRSDESRPRLLRMLPENRIKVRI